MEVSDINSDSEDGNTNNTKQTLANGDQLSLLRTALENQSLKLLENYTPMIYQSYLQYFPKQLEKVLKELHPNINGEQAPDLAQVFHPKNCWEKNPSPEQFIKNAQETIAILKALVAKLQESSIHGEGRC